MNKFNSIIGYADCRHYDLKGEINLLVKYNKIRYPPTLSKEVSQQISLTKKNACAFLSQLMESAEREGVLTYTQDKNGEKQADTALLTVTPKDYTKNAHIACTAVIKHRPYRITLILASDGTSLKDVTVGKYSGETCTEYHTRKQFDNAGLPIEIGKLVSYFLSKAESMI